MDIQLQTNFLWSISKSPGLCDPCSLIKAYSKIKLSETCHYWHWYHLQPKAHKNIQMVEICDEYLLNVFLLMNSWHTVPVATSWTGVWNCTTINWTVSRMDKQYWQAPMDYVITDTETTLEPLNVELINIDYFNKCNL